MSKRSIRLKRHRPDFRMQPKVSAPKTPKNKIGLVRRTDRRERRALWLSIEKKERPPWTTWNLSLMSPT